MHQGHLQEFPGRGHGHVGSCDETCCFLEFAIAISLRPGVLRYFQALFPPIGRLLLRVSPPRNTWEGCDVSLCHSLPH